jgi:hypothetical protein
MATKEIWARFHSTEQYKGTDEEIISMIDDIISGINLIEMIYGIKESRMMTRGMLQDWHALAGIANARGLKYKYP